MLKQYFHILKHTVTDSNTRNVKNLRRGTRWKSLLRPFEDEIRQLRKDGKTYREIATMLNQKHGENFTYTYAAIWHFVKARSGRIPYELAEKGRGGDNEGQELVIRPVPRLPEPPAVAAQTTNWVRPSSLISAVPTNVPPAPAGSLLPNQFSKFRDSAGRPVPPPPDPRKFRVEEL